MRIALVMLDQNYGGMQQDFLNYSIELSKRGFPVLCVIRNESFVEKKFRKAGISSTAVINNRFGFHDPFAIRQIGEALDEFFHNPPPHIVHSFGSRATLFASRLKSQVRRWPLIASLPNSINHKYYKGADILVPSTNQMATSNYHKNLVDPVFSEVIPHFSSVEPVSETVYRPRILNIFAAGRFVRKKGFDFLLKAIPDVLAGDCRIQFQIAGDGPEFDELKMLQTELKLEDKVQFLGFRNDVSLLMKQSDLFVMPSLSEPFGIILLEAMATGIPIVTTRNNGALHILNGDTAIFVDKASSSSLSSGILEAINNPEAAFERSKNALELFRNHYTPDAVMPKILSLYQTVSKDCLAN